jgi:hypothetical protein
MDIRQVALGAAVAAVLVFGAEAATPGQVAAPSISATSVVDGVTQAVRARAERVSDALLDAVFNAAGDIEARVKQVF